MYNAATTQVEFKVGLSLLEMLIGPVMFAVTCNEKPVFSILVKSTAAVWDCAKLATAVAVGVHLCFQIPHLTCLHL